MHWMARVRTAITELRFVLALVIVGFVVALSGCASTTAADRETAESNANALPDSENESDTRRRARLRTELAAGYYGQRNTQVALEELRQAVAIDPTYAPAHGLLGLILMDLGDAVRAEASFNRALSLAPNDSELNNNFGWFLCQTNRVGRSFEFFQRAARNPLYRTPSRPWHNAGICALRQKDEAAAEDYFQKALQADPNNPVALFNLAEIYLKRKELDRAQRLSQMLLRGYEPNAQTLWLGLRIERALGNQDNEASLATQLRRRFPAAPETTLLMNGRFGE
jgi:type IV pilus assembly protein PilF